MIYWPGQLCSNIIFKLNGILTKHSSLIKLLVGAGSLFLVSSDKYFILTSERTRLLLLSLALCLDCDGNISANQGSFQRANLPIGCPLLHFIVTGCVTMSWFAVETSDVPCILKLASNDLTSWAAGDTVSRLELSWDGPVYTAATFPTKKKKKKREKKPYCDFD